MCKGLPLLWDQRVQELKSTLSLMSPFSFLVSSREIPSRRVPKATVAVALSNFNVYFLSYIWINRPRMQVYWLRIKNWVYPIITMTPTPRIAESCAPRDGAVIVSLAFLGTVAVAGRLASRKLKKVSWASDDWTAVAAMVLLWKLSLLSLN